MLPCRAAATQRCRELELALCTPSHPSIRSGTFPGIDRLSERYLYATTTQATLQTRTHRPWFALQLPLPNGQSFHTGPNALRTSRLRLPEPRQTAVIRTFVHNAGSSESNPERDSSQVGLRAWVEQIAGIRPAKGESRPMRQQPLILRVMKPTNVRARIKKTRSSKSAKRGSLANSTGVSHKKIIRLSPRAVTRRRVNLASRTWDHEERGSGAGATDFPFEKQTGPVSKASRRKRASGKLVLETARRLIKIGDYTGAYKRMRFAATRGVDVNSNIFLKTCGVYLQRARQDRNVEQSCSDIMAILLELNIQPTIVIYNTLIQHASETNDPETAWDIYNMIRENDIAPDEITYTILFKLCRKTNDRGAYTQLLGHLLPLHMDYLDPILGAEVLQCRHMLEDRYNFGHMLLAFERHHDLEPLKSLGMIPPDHESRFQGSHPLPRPQPKANHLKVMLKAFLYSEQHLEAIQLLYENFQARLSARDPAILPLVADADAYNIFLKAMSRFPLSFGIIPAHMAARFPELRWYNILKDMTASHNPPASEPAEGDPPPQLKPTRITWGIILLSYARQKLVFETEGILEAMIEHGFNPDVITWNSMISGFCRRTRERDLDYIASLLHRMKASGVLANDVTVWAISHITDPLYRTRVFDKVKRLESQASREQKSAVGN